MNYAYPSSRTILDRIASQVADTCGATIHTPASAVDGGSGVIKENLGRPWRYERASLGRPGVGEAPGDRPARMGSPEPFLKRSARATSNSRASRGSPRSITQALAVVPPMSKSRTFPILFCPDLTLIPRAVRSAVLDSAMITSEGVPRSTRP